MSNLLPWQDRVIEEHADLAQKIVRLANFMTTDDFRLLGESPRNLLHSQLNVMNTYLSILESRIDRFVPELKIV